MRRGFAATGAIRRPLCEVTLGISLLLTFPGSAPADGEAPEGALALDAASPPDARTVLSRLSDRRLDELFSEKILLLDSRTDAETVEGLVIFAQPRESTFELLAQSGRQNEFRPELRDVRTIERFEGGSLDEHRMRIMFLDIGYRLRSVVDTRRAWIRWQLDPEFDNDLEHVSGSWKIFDLDEERSLGLFGTAVRVGRALPGFLQRQVTRKNVPTTLSRCRRWVDSGGTWRP